MAKVKRMINVKGDKDVLITSTRDAAGRWHSENDKPAVVTRNGLQMWFHHGRLHREAGKPAVIAPNGDMEFISNGTPLPAQSGILNN